MPQDVIESHLNLLPKKDERLLSSQDFHWLTQIRVEVVKHSFGAQGGRCSTSKFYSVGVRISSIYLEYTSYYIK